MESGPTAAMHEARHMQTLHNAADPVARRLSSGLPHDGHEEPLAPVWGVVERVRDAEGLANEQLPLHLRPAPRL